MKSGGISHNQKAFKAKFPFNFKAKFSLVNKRISAPQKIPLAGKWSLLSMYSVNRNLARCQGNEGIVNLMFVWVIEGVPFEHQGALRRTNLSGFVLNMNMK